MDIVEIKKKAVVYSIPGMEQAKVRPNIVYKSVGGQDLCMDVYYPAAFAFTTTLPAVIFIHGDGPVEWIQDVKDWGQYISWGQLIAASGLIGITFNHRSANGQQSGIKAVAEDIRDLIDYVRTNAVSLLVDPERLCIWACSAGVPYLQDFFIHPHEFIRCLVAYYGIVDISNPEMGIPPFFIAQAGLDDPASNAALDQFYARCWSTGLNIELVRHPLGHHGFDVLDDDETSKYIIQRTLQFMKENLGFTEKSSGRTA
jgi:hypothetical protein